MNTPSSSPPVKRPKLELPPSTTVGRTLETYEERPFKREGTVNSTENEPQCSICLQPIIDRTVIPTCSHEFCFECLLVWSEQSRRCPLCSQAIGQYIIHNIRSRYDFRKHYLTPLHISPEPLQGLAREAQEERIHRRRTARVRERDVRMREEREESDKLERSIANRRWIYQRDLYAKHVASNSYTKYRPYPTPAQFSASPELISRTTTFLRRELQVWDDLDVEFLTSFIISLMKSIDIRSESAVKLLAEFLDMDAPYVEGGRHVNAEHFAHEVYTYVRSPFRDLFVYDTVAQYDTPQGASSAEPRRGRRWREASWSRSRSRSPSHRALSPSLGNRGRRRKFSMSWSPSGRNYPDESTREEISNVPTASQSDRPRHRSRERSHHRDSDVISRDRLRGRDRSPESRRTYTKQEPSSDDSLVHVNSRRNAKREPYNVRPANGIPDYGPDHQYTKRDLSTDRSPTHGGSVTGVIKGKEREENETYIRTGLAPYGAGSEHMPSPETTDLLDSSKSRIRDKSPDSPPSKRRASNQTRPPRNRNLLESVRAHLTLAPRGHPSRLQAEHTPLLPDSRTTPPQTRPSDANTDTTQSTHEGLTSGGEAEKNSMLVLNDVTRTRARRTRNNVMPSPSVTVQSHGADASAVPYGREALIAGAEETSRHWRGGISDIDVSPISRDRAPETTDQAAKSFPPISQASEYISTRKARQDSPEVATSGPSSATLPPPWESHSHVSPSSSIGGISDSGTIKDISRHPSTSSPGARGRLLAKLEEEKTCARRADSTATMGITSPNPSTFDRTFPGSADRLHMKPGPLTDVQIVGIQSIEAKLRTRAHIRVRLAAEKKNTSS